jgi:acetolactate synthase-1/2/3 large subunit
MSSGAHCLLQTAADAGVSVCFANPGTTEMPLVAALDSVPNIRAVLGLFEGVCTGAADGFGRMTGRPALTLLHLGPGLGNGIANLHNARRAHSPVVNLIGDHATWHLEHDAPLTSDIASLARPVSGWVRSATSSKRLADDMAEAIAAATGPPGQVATLIVPANVQSGEGTDLVAVRNSEGPHTVEDRVIATATDRLREAGPAAILLGADALGASGQVAAARIAAATGALLFVETFPSRWERGLDLPAIDKLPYFPEQAIQALGGVATLLLAGAREPVAFFGYEGLPSRLAPGDSCVPLAEPGQDAEGALETLADALGASTWDAPDVAPAPPPQADTPLDPGVVGLVLAACLPKNAIVVDEAATTGLPFYAASAGSPRHTVLGLTGGAIGQGLPCAVGAAVACPDRKVIAFQADGSGQYTVQSLFTMARESLDVVVLICSNRSYRILQVELARAGVAEPGPQARGLTSLESPELDWVSIAQGYGVPATRVETAGALVSALQTGLREPGPQLVEMVL